MKSKGNLISLEGGGNKNALREEVEAMRQNLPHFIEHVKMIAELSKAKYDACIEQGFDENQALELSKNPLGG